VSDTTQRTSDLPAWTDLDDRAVTMTRGLAMDAVQKAGNGHPGTAMALSLIHISEPTRPY
jgi:hypothetical protein